MAQAKACPTIRITPAPDPASHPPPSQILRYWLLLHNRPPHRTARGHLGLRRWWFDSARPRPDLPREGSERQEDRFSIHLCKACLKDITHLALQGMLEREMALCIRVQFGLDLFQFLFDFAYFEAEANGNADEGE